MGSHANSIAAKSEAVSEVMKVRQVDGAQAPSITSLILPAPPSVNAMFKNIPGKGRARTKLYEDWLGHAGWRLKAQRPKAVPGPVILVIGVERTSALADIDNRLKASLDLLVDHKLIDDDRFVVGLATAWSPKRDALMRIAIVPAGPLSLQFQLASDGAHGGWFINAPQPEEGDACHGDRHFEPEEDQGGPTATDPDLRPGEDGQDDAGV